ncbi:MAG: rhomboid family intramembrane serine protease [Planctomycetota bacterium]
MIPIRDNIPSRTFPIVNYLLIAACVVVFVMQPRGENEGQIFAERYGLVPVRVFEPAKSHSYSYDVEIATFFGIEKRTVRHDIAPAAVPDWLTLLTCIFLHGGLAHILGNLWFLFIFGDNVEDRLGHFGYLLFYLACGIAASATQLAVASDSPIPTIGASGAIAGVLGAYFYLYPHAKVQTLVPVVLILMLVVPAPLFLGVWFLLQFLQSSPGVAWWAHIGGFVAGFVVVVLLGRGHHLRPAVETRRPGTDHAGYYRVRRGRW